MPSGRATPGRASRSPSPSQPPAAAGEPVSCERVLTTTAAFLDARPGTVQARCFFDSYGAGELDANLGWRTGHSLVLSADQRQLCVVGGLSTGESVREGQVERYVESSAEDESDSETIPIAVQLPAVAADKSKLNGTSQQDHTPSLPKAAVPPANNNRVKSSPARPSGRAVTSTTTPPKSTSHKAPEKPSSAGAAPSPPRTVEHNAVGGTPNTSDAAAAATSPRRPREVALPAVPSEWRTRVPMVECLDLGSRIWFVPLGEQRRAAAVVASAAAASSSGAEAASVLRGGGIRWPAQSVSAVIWDARAPTQPTTLSSPTSTPPTNAPLTPTPPPPPQHQQSATAVPTDASGTGSGDSPAGRRRPKGSKAPLTATPPPAAPAPASANTNGSPNAASPASATLAAKEKAREKRRQLQAAKQAQEAALAEQKRQRRLEARQRREARWSAGPADVAVFGGWEKGRRLPTAMTYRLDAPAESAPLMDTVHGSLPAVEMLPSPMWVPVTGHTATLVRDKYFVFGGHAATGSTNELYMLENTRLRLAYEAAAQRALQEDTKRLNMTFRSRNSITLGGSTYTVEMRDGLISVGGQSDAARGDTNLTWSCTLVGGQRYDALNEGGNASPAHTALSATAPSTAEPSRMASTVISTNSRLRARPGSHLGAGGSADAGTSQQQQQQQRPGTALSALAVASAPAPAPRSSHCAATLANRFVVIFGGRQLVQAGPLGGGGGGGLGGSAVAAAGTTGSKPRAVSRSRGKSQSKGRNAGAGGADEETTLPTLTLLDDVAAYDTETGVWVQVRVSGATGPCARYGAAMCALPFSPGADRTRFPPATALRVLNSPTSESAYAQRELFLHGGIDAAGNVLNDAWVLQATGKHTQWLLERDPKSGVSVLAVRWIAIRAEQTVAELLPPAPQDPNGSSLDDLADGASSKKKKNRSGSTSKGAATDTAKALQAQLMKTKVSVLPHRAHHAIVANVLRDVFLVGGEDAPIKVAIEGAEPALLTQLGQAVNQHGRDVVRVLHVSPLDAVEEVTVERPRAKSRPRDKA